MPVWSRTEVLVAREAIYPLTHDIKRVLYVLSIVGGIPRFVFKPYSFNPEKEIKLAIAEDIDHIHKYCISIGKLGAVEQSNHLLLHMLIQPGDTTYTDGYVLFASPYVAQLVARELEEQMVLEIMSIVKGSEGAGKMAAWRGQLFEGMVNFANCYN